MKQVASQIATSKLSLSLYKYNYTSTYITAKVVSLAIIASKLGAIKHG